MLLDRLSVAVAHILPMPRLFTFARLNVIVVALLVLRHTARPLAVSLRDALILLLRTLRVKSKKLAASLVNVIHLRAIQHAYSA